MADCERQPVRKVGMIMKQGSFVKNWKLRWLELRVSCMQYFQCQPPAPAKLKGTVHLTSDCKVGAVGLGCLHAALRAGVCMHACSCFAHFGQMGTLHILWT
eukprot:TRINITY_DN10399_c0_g1_i1.p1 TRINITY_DN10399_c0_g1~~TRINITY_DN10399_c0_g1_i1.p1  ORF type:complete len:101 (+),score=5.08 TRINITY_DN10399_c0_g1_i1:242-544(+)